MFRRGLLVVFAICWIITTSNVSTVYSAVAPGCQNDGTNCAVGSVGPGGGIVYYDAGSMQWWGRFLEAKTTSVPAAGPWGTIGLGKIQPQNSKELGMGLSNSMMMANLSYSVFARLKDKVFTEDFYLPSKDELDTLYNYWKTSHDSRLKYSAAPIWSSTESSAYFAWYQLFQDGTQFTDANGIIPKLAGNKYALQSPKHVGSDFVEMDFQVIAVRAFPQPTESTTMPANVVTTPVENASCSAGGSETVCKIGDIGPGGGIVYFDAGKEEWWGRYLEMAPKSCEGIRWPWRPGGKTAQIYKDANGQTAADLRVLAKGVGMGKVNTRVITVALGAGNYAAKYSEDLVCNGKDDWFLPSKDELDLAFNRLAQNRVGSNESPVGGFNKGYYWTSTDYNNKTAWSQYFMDGQQFDRVQTMDGNKKPPNPFRVRPIRAFGKNFLSLSCKDGGICKVGDIGPGGGKVFYVAPDLLIANGKSWRYLEVSSSSQFLKLCSSTKNLFLTDGGLGVGYENTKMLRTQCGGDKAIGVVIGGKSDWYIPTMAELGLASNQVPIYTDVWSSEMFGKLSAWAYDGIDESILPVILRLKWLPVRRFG